MKKPSQLIAALFPWVRRRYERSLESKRESRKHRGKTMKTIGRFGTLNLNR